jgi:hypothetical protein
MAVDPSFGGGGVGKRTPGNLSGNGKMTPLPPGEEGEEERNKETYIVLFLPAVALRPATTTSLAGLFITVCLR